MSGLSSLELGKRALLAHRFGLDVTSNNIANVNTPGYSRRSALLTETDPHKNSGQYFGTGSMVEQLRTFREEFFDREIRNTLSRKAGYDNDEKVYQRLESILAEPTELGFTEQVNDFLKAFEELALNPENIAQRDTILGQAQTLVEQFNRTATQLTELRQEVASSINIDIDKANQLLIDIAELNKNIANSKAETQNEAQTYVDQREQKLEELSELTGVNVTYDSKGMAYVYLNGMNLVSGPSSNQLKSNETTNPVTGERTIQILQYDPKTNVSNVINVQSGSIASDLKHYNVTLDDADSSDGFSAFTKLNDYVNALVTKVNSLTMGGYGLDDAGPNPPGRNFFNPTVGKATAANISLSSDIKDKPRNIPFASRAGEPGNAEVALAIGRIAQDSTFLEGQRPSEFYSGFLGRLGTIAKEADNGKTTTKLVADQLSNQRESTIGVNLDEEAVNLIKFQKGFEAASRIVNVTNELLTTIVNLGR